MNKLEQLLSLNSSEDIQNYLKNLELSDEEIKDFFENRLSQKNFEEKIFLLKNLIWSTDPILIKTLKNYILTYADSKIKASWVKSIPLKERPEFIPFVAKLLKDTDNRVRANSVEALSIFGSQQLKDLLLPLLKDPDNRTKSNTLIALWKYEELRNYIKNTFTEMLSDPSRWMRASAFYAFGEIGLEEFTEECIKALNDQDEIIAKNAVLALINYAENNLKEKVEGKNAPEENSPRR